MFSLRGRPACGSWSWNRYRILSTEDIAPDQEEAKYESDLDSGLSVFSASSRYMILFLVGALTVFIVVESQNFYSASQTSKWQDKGFPAFSLEAVTFIENPLFTEPPGNESNTAWESLMPGRRGYVVLDHPEDYGVEGKPGVPNNGIRNKYALSVFHQLHCLALLREAYYSAIDGRQAQIYGEEKLTDEQRQHARGHHVSHCFDYLRQSLMCAGDMTVEWARRDAAGKWLADVDGWGITHRQCRNWEEIYGWALEHVPEDENDGGIV